MSYTDGPVAIVRAEPHHGVEWRGLFVSYCAAGGVNATDVSVSRVWSWIADPSAQTSCLVASVADVLVGFVHFRVFERPITASTGLWIDDLYVDRPRRPAAARAGGATARTTVSSRGPPTRCRVSIIVLT